MSAVLNRTSQVIAGLARFYKLDPSLIDIDIVTIMGRWDGADSASTVQPDAFQFDPGYEHVIFGIAAFAQAGVDDVGPDDADFVRVEFNIFTSYENKFIFPRALNFGAFLRTDLVTEPYYLVPGFKKLPNRATVSVKLTASQFDPTWAGEPAVVGVEIWGARLNIKEGG